MFLFPDNIRYIEEFLSAFEEPKQIASWSNQGKIIMDYIDINKKVIKNQLLLCVEGFFLLIICCFLTHTV